MAKFPDVSGMTGVAYETTDKDNFDHSLQFVFDYSDLDRSSNDVKRALSEFASDIDSLNKELRISGNRNSPLFDISPKQGRQAASMVDSTGRQVLSVGLLAKGKALGDEMRPGLQDLGQLGKTTMMQYANRVDTGRMRGSIFYKTSVTNKRATVTIGWIKLWYKYFGFQENGTVKVKPMHSVLRTMLHLMPLVQKFASQVYRGVGLK